MSLVSIDFVCHQPDVTIKTTGTPIKMLTFKTIFSPNIMILWQHKLKVSKKNMFKYLCCGLCENTPYCPYALNVAICNVDTYVINQQFVLHNIQTDLFCSWMS